MKKSLFSLLLPILIMTVFLLTACSGLQPTEPPDPTPTPVGYQEVTFTTQDDRVLKGRLFEGGDQAVILAHTGPLGATQKDWRAFAELAYDQGFTILTFNFRGIGGSQGDLGLEMNYTYLDVIAAVEFLRSHGYQDMACMGASLGGTACLRAALEVDFIGIAVLASPLSVGEPTKITEDDLAAFTFPKLFITAKNDQGFVVEDMEKMNELSPPPKDLVLYGGAAHGTALFNTEHGEDLENLLLEFLKSLE